jgi:glucokinase
MDFEIIIHIERKKFKKQKYNQFVLAGDVGATNSRVRVSGISAQGIESLYDVRYSSTFLEEFVKHTAETISLAKNNYGIDRIEKAAFGVPGRISKDRKNCTITFLDWGENTPLVDIIHRMGIKQVYLMNDLEAGAHGVMMANEKNLIKISAPETSLPQKENYSLILGMPGTGFGNGYRDENGLSKPTEGGGRAVAISPTSKIEHDLLMCIYKEINKNNLSSDEENLPTYDYIVSGPGIKRIKDTLLKQEKYANYPKQVINRINSFPPKDQSIVITSLASGKDPLCKEGKGDELSKEVVEIFCKFFARAMQGIALLAFPEAVFLGGNIVNSIHNFLNYQFIKYFTAHFNHKGFLKKLPVYIIVNEDDLNLKGATYAAISLTV